MNNSVIKPAPGFRLLTTWEQDEQFKELLHQNIMNRVYKQLGTQYLDKAADTFAMQVNAANQVRS